MLKYKLISFVVLSSTSGILLGCGGAKSPSKPAESPTLQTEERLMKAKFPETNSPVLRKSEGTERCRKEVMMKVPTEGDGGTGEITVLTESNGSVHVEEFQGQVLRREKDQVFESKTCLSSLINCPNEAWIASSGQVKTIELERTETLENGNFKRSIHRVSESLLKSGDTKADAIKKKEISKTVVEEIYRLSGRNKHLLLSGQDGVYSQLNGAMVESEERVGNTTVTTVRLLRPFHIARAKEANPIKVTKWNSKCTFTPK